MLQVFVCGAYEPDVYRYGLVVTDSCDASVLKGAQQLCLQMQRDVAYLIKEERSSVCLLELADMIRMRISKCAFNMAEEFTLKQSLCDSSGIHAYHRSERPVRRPVDLTSKHILTGTVFTSNEHRCISWGNLLYCLPYAVHSRAFAPEHLH